MKKKQENIYQQSILSLPVYFLLSGVFLHFHILQLLRIQDVVKGQEVAVVALFLTKRYVNVKHEVLHVIIIA